MDPYAILATLGFGVFLFNVIFNLLNNAPAGNAMSGRSLDVADIDIPLALSDIVSNGDPQDVSGFYTESQTNMLTPHSNSQARDDSLTFT